MQNTLNSVQTAVLPRCEVAVGLSLVNIVYIIYTLELFSASMNMGSSLRLTRFIRVVPKVWLPPTETVLTILLSFSALGRA